MTTFDEREQGFEKKFALDQETMFRAHARRDKLFGLWAAGQLGLSGSEAEAYAKALVSEDIAHPGDKGIAGKVLAELKGKGVTTTMGDLEKKLEELFAVARTDVSTEASRRG